MNNNSGFANNALNSRTIEADEIYTGNLTATTTTSTIQDFTDLTTDSVNEKTSGAGVTVDGVLLKDNTVSASGSIETDYVNEHTTNAGVIVSGVHLRDGIYVCVGVIGDRPQCLPEEFTQSVRVMKCCSDVIARCEQRLN
uniref:Uncharacterized protein n=1 Tax=Percolomonas cosmopolitus TaxID=63605 RepID=A0A7S1KRQ9_9EUKA|mmetsp:Transcript_6531/g.24550  ORF Transcript_6531/g.24550 Transcript_6531/m.24550 type:complete len:140 (+) Transcript_6531:111-530(+)